MRKITTDMENPIDNIIIYIADRASGIYKNMGLTPNHLTTFSLICNVLSACLFYYDHRYMSVLLFMIGYYFDCADGFYARKYDMVTTFGDYYDHINDQLKILLILIVMYLKSKCKFFSILPIIAALTLLSLMHLGCQEKIYDQYEPPDILV
jgi:phosphatidylglycerophosphate synthase